MPGRIARAVAASALLVLCAAAAFASPPGARAAEPPGVPFEYIFGAQQETSAREAFAAMVRTDEGRAKIMALEQSPRRSSLLRRWLGMGTKGRVFPKLVGGFNIVGLAITGYLIYREINGTPEWYEVILNDELGPDGLPVLEDQPADFGTFQTAVWQQAGWYPVEDEQTCGLLNSEWCYAFMAKIATTLGNASGPYEIYEPYHRFVDVEWCLDDLDRLGDECSSLMGDGFYGSSNWEGNDHRLYYQGRRVVAMEAAADAWGGYVVTMDGDGYSGAFPEEAPHKAAVMTEGQYEAAIGANIEAINKLEEEPDEDDYGAVVETEVSGSRPNDDDLDAIGTYLDDECGRALVNWLMDDDNYDAPETCAQPTVSDPMVLPKPGLNETYAAYVTRLRGLGWLGEVDDLELLPEDDYVVELGARAVVSINSSSGLFVHRLSWPVGAAQRTISKSDDLSFTINAANAPTQPGDEGGGGGGIPPTVPPIVGEGTCEPWLEEELDLSPLLGLELGEHFPFGVLPWAVGFIASLGAEPVTPEWTFPDVELGGAVTLPLSGTAISLEQGDEPMEWFRLVVSFVLWVGFIWYAGTTILGLKAGENPVDAAPEATL